MRTEGKGLDLHPSIWIMTVFRYTGTNTTPLLQGTVESPPAWLHKTANRNQVGFKKET